MITPTTEPTLEEQVHGLKETAARLAAERDVAVQMASQATKDLVRVRREHEARLETQRVQYEARLKVLGVQIDSLRIGADGKNAEIRQLTARVHDLAIANEDMQRQLDAAQRQSTPAPRRWWRWR